MRGDIIPTQTVKSNMILIIMVLISLSVQAETISNKIIDPSDGIVEDLVEMKDFRQVLNEFAKLKEDFKNNSIKLNRLEKQIADEPNLDDILEKLKQLSRIGTLRSCEEYAAFGIRTSGMFPIDPDGILVGQPPFAAYCRFDDNTGQVVTEVMHMYSESLNNVEHCPDPGCYVKNLTYVSGDDGHHIETSQLEALIELSSDCEQSFYYECTLAPLRKQDVDYAYWTGTDGERNFYFTGSDSSIHSCDCFYSEDGCEAHDVLNTTCNCDSIEPTPLLDTGLLMKSSSLPIKSIAFGGLSFEMQQASYTIGRLICKGKKENKIGTSCKSLKLAGETRSGYYTLKKQGSTHTSTVYCDMSTGGYETVPEFKQLSSASPLGTITSWTPKDAMDSEDKLDLPDGWLPCDVRSIENGLWAGRVTPDLNTNGHFLRGGQENNAMEFEEDQMQDHEHTDAGHSHSSSPHSHSYLDSFVGGEGQAFPWSAGADRADHSRNTDAASVMIESAASNIGGVSSSFRSGAETRPRNMKVIWIMKCW